MANSRRAWNSASVGSLPGARIAHVTAAAGVRVAEPPGLPAARKVVFVSLLSIFPEDASDLVSVAASGAASAGPGPQP
jgi:hypothetical protein